MTSQGQKGKKQLAKSTKVQSTTRLKQMIQDAIVKSWQISRIKNNCSEQNTSEYIEVRWKWCNVTLNEDKFLIQWDCQEDNFGVKNIRLWTMLRRRITYSSTAENTQTAEEK